MKKTTIQIDHDLLKVLKRKRLTKRESYNEILRRGLDKIEDSYKEVTEI